MVKQRFRWLNIVIVAAMISSHCNWVSASENPSCSAASTIALRRTVQYGIFGNDQFDTIVCGYLVTRLEESFGKQMTIAYFRITKFSEVSFSKAIEDGIQTGNSVNKTQNGQYDFSLGCVKDSKIIGDEEQSSQSSMSETVQKALLQSSAKQPVAIVLSFEQHPGSDCLCCQLAEQVRLAD